MSGENAINNKEGLNSVEKQFVWVMEKIIYEYSCLPMNDTNRSNVWLTKEIKEIFGQVGEEKGFKILSTLHGGEWLYDLVWYESNNANNNIEKVHLVMESELSSRSKSGLKHDFSKLFLAEAKYKVFICFNEGNYNYPQNLNHLIDFFEKAVADYRGQKLNSRILILIWDDYYTGLIHPHLILKS